MAQIFNIDGETINPATEEKQDALLVAMGGAAGVPEYGADAVGANAYASVVTSTVDRSSFYLHVSVENNGAIISLDEGNSDHFAVPANTERLFPGLSIPAGTDIQAKNLSTDSNYTNVRISVW